MPFITALDAVDIAITGADGSMPARPNRITGIPAPDAAVIDGRGRTWMAANFDCAACNKSQHDVLHDHRPHMIQLVNCSGVRLRGFFMHDSPMYHLSFYRGRGYDISNLVMWSPAAATSKAGYWNTDGIDIGAEYVWVHNVWIHNGDDSIIVKGRYPENAPPSAGCFGGRHVLVENSTAVGGLGMGLGTGSFTAVNVTYRDIVIGDTSGGSSGGPGIHIKSHEDRQSGSVKDVLFERIQMHSVGKAIDVSNKNQDDSADDGSDDEDDVGRSRVNTYDNVTFSQITVEQASYAYHFDCVSEAPCTNFEFKDIAINWTVKPWDLCSNVSGRWSDDRDISPSLLHCVTAPASTAGISDSRYMVDDD